MHTQAEARVQSVCHTRRRAPETPGRANGSLTTAPGGSALTRADSCKDTGLGTAPSGTEPPVHTCSGNGGADRRAAGREGARLAPFPRPPPRSSIHFGGAVRRAGSISPALLRPEGCLCRNTHRESPLRPRPEGCPFHRPHPPSSLPHRHKQPKTCRGEEGLLGRNGASPMSATLPPPRASWDAAWLTVPSSERRCP